MWYINKPYTQFRSHALQWLCVHKCAFTWVYVYEGVGACMGLLAWSLDTPAPALWQSSHEIGQSCSICWSESHLSPLPFLSLFFFNSFTESQFSYHESYPFEVYIQQFLLHLQNFLNLIQSPHPHLNLAVFTANQWKERMSWLYILKGLWEFSGDWLDLLFQSQTHRIRTWRVEATALFTPFKQEPGAHTLLHGQTVR